MLEFLLNKPDNIIIGVIFFIFITFFSFGIKKIGKLDKEEIMFFTLISAPFLFYFFLDYLNYKVDKNMDKNIKMIQEFSKEEKESFINKLSKEEKVEIIKKIEEIRMEEELERKISEFFMEGK